MRLMAIGLWAVLCLAAVPVMANSKSFVCVNEKDHLPPLDSQADVWYREAAALAKPDTLRPWGPSGSSAKGSIVASSKLFLRLPL